MTRPRSAPSLLVALALSTGVSAQSLTFTARTGSPRMATQRTDRIGARDCAARERWTFRLEFPSATTSVPEVWVGTDSDCAPASREPNPGATCFQLCGTAHRDVCATPLRGGASSYTVDVPAHRLADPLNGDCVAQNVTRRLFAVVAGETVARANSVVIDTVPPPAPTSVQATAGEGQLTVAWDLPVTDAGTDAGFVTDLGDLDGGTDAGFDAGVDAGNPDDAGDAGIDAPIAVDAGSVANATAEPLGAVYVLCDPPGDAAAPVIADGGDGGCGTGALSRVDPDDDQALARYRCNGADGGTGSPAVIGGLRNGVAVQVAVVLEDRAGNRSVPVLSSRCDTPRSLTDFWEHYRSQGGAGHPGYCSARPGSVGARGLLALLAVMGTGLLGRGRRRR